MSQSHLVFAADIGGVLMTDDTDTGASVFNLDSYLESAEVAGSFKALAQIADWCSGQIGLISKCGPLIQQRSMEWLEHHRLTERTGIRLDDVYFCHDRPDKAPIAKRLGLRHFVDDRYDVLSYMTSVPNRILFRPNAKDKRRFAQNHNGIIRCDNWFQISSDIRRTSPPA